jgi:hypothetical protein
MQLIALLLLLARDQCIDPRMESMAWRTFEGEVQSFDANGELHLIDVVAWHDHLTPRVVRLATVEIDPTAQPFLRSLVGKRVSVWINPRYIDDEHVSGIVYRGQKDINQTLLARGLGRYIEPPAYVVSDYSGCLHRIAEREARAARRGVWAK